MEIETGRRRRRRTGRRIALFAALPLVLAGAAHTVLWQVMSRRLAEGWAGWAEARRSEGWQVTHGPAQAGGWPLAATLALPGLRVEAALPGGLAWQAERARLRVEMARPATLHVEAPGAGMLRLGAGTLPYVAETLRAEIPLQAGAAPDRATISAGGLRLGPAAEAVLVGAARVSLQGRAGATREEPALALTLVAEAVDLPAAPPGGGLGRRVEALDADLALTGPLPQARSPAARAEAWRQGGGTLELRGVTLRWGPVGAAGAATLALDQALQPAGAGTLRVTGATALVEALAAGGVLDRRAAGTARSLVPLLARPPAGGGPPVLEVPLTLERRTLSLGPIPVSRLPALEWPGVR